MNPDFWAIIGVGVALAVLQWRLYCSLNARMGRIETRLDRIETRLDHIDADLANIRQRLSRIEGWISGRFGEELPPPA